MDERPATALLPLVLPATFLVAVVPLLLVIVLRWEGFIVSAWAGVIVGVAGSFALSYAGSVLWRRVARSNDVLFSDLMLWGWFARCRSTRRVQTASTRLAEQPADGSRAERAALLSGLIADLERGDRYTHGHSRRVARHAARIARRVGLPQEEVSRIHTAGTVHDVGKLQVPTAILHKEGRLTPEEFATVAGHAAVGAEMVAGLGDEALTAIVRHHHERLDGGGYPDAIAGAAIPLGARIMAVADTFDAITSTRPYRRAHSHQDALRILDEVAGSQLDPEIVAVFRRCYAGRGPLAFWSVLANAWARSSSAIGAWSGAGAAHAALGTSAVVAAGLAGAAGTGLTVDTPPATAASVALNAVASAPPSPTLARGTAAFKAVARSSTIALASPSRWSGAATPTGSPRGSGATATRGAYPPGSTRPSVPGPGPTGLQAGAGGGAAGPPPSGAGIPATAPSPSGARSIQARAGARRKRSKRKKDTKRGTASKRRRTTQRAEAERAMKAERGARVVKVKADRGRAAETAGPARRSQPPRLTLPRKRAKHKRA